MSRRCGRSTGSTRARPGRPVRRLPVADGAVLRALHALGLSRGSSSGCGWARSSRCRLGRRAAHGRPASSATAALAHRRRPGVRACNPTWSFLGPHDITLLAYAALPWLLLGVHRGVRDRAGGWRVARRVRARRSTSTGGGVNAAVLGLGARRAAAAPALRAALGAASLAGRCGPACARRSRAGGRQRVVGRAGARPRPLRDRLPAVHRAAGDDLGDDVADRVAAADGLLDVLHRRRLRRRACSRLRGLGHAALQPRRWWSPSLLRARRWRSAASCGRGAGATAPFFLLLSLVGVVIMVAGFPEGTPLRRGLTFTYNHVAVAAVPAHDLQGGAAGRARAGGASAARRGVAARAGSGPAAAPSRGAAGAVAALLAVAAWPLVARRGIGARSWVQDPGRLDAGRRRPDRARPLNSRAMVLPGQLFAFYRWGGTIDPILPALTDRPVAIRYDRRPTPTCTRSTCSGRRHRSSSSARLPGQLRAAAAPDGRGARSSTGDRRRPLAQRRRSSARRGRRGARRPGPRPAGQGLRPDPARRAGAGRARRRRGAARSCAATTRRPRRPSCASLRGGRRRSSTARRRSSRRSPPSARCRGDTPLLYAADLSAAGAPGRGHGGRRVASATPTAGARSWPRGCAQNRRRDADRRRRAARRRRVPRPVRTDGVAPMRRRSRC